MSRSATIALFAVASLVAASGGVYFATHRPANERAVGNSVAGSPSSASFFAETLPDSSGKPVPLDDFRGKITVVNFWAPWCEPCVEEIPAFSRLQSEFHAKAVRFVGVGIDSAEHIAAFQVKIPTTYPLLVAPDAGSALAREFGNSSGALPFTVLLNKKGAVIASKMGKISEGELRSWLTKLVEHS